MFTVSLKEAKYVIICALNDDYEEIEKIFENKRKLKIYDDYSDESMHNTSIVEYICSLNYHNGNILHLLSFMLRYVHDKEMLAACLNYCAASIMSYDLFQDFVLLEYEKPLYAIQHPYYKRFILDRLLEDHSNTYLWDIEDQFIDKIYFLLSLGAPHREIYKTSYLARRYISKKKDIFDTITGLQILLPDILESCIMPYVIPYESITKT